MLIESPFNFAKEFLLLVLILPFILSIFILKYFSKPKSNKDRKPGQWYPESYKWPIPPPYPKWDILKTDPIPYRAFKHKYNVTMGISSLDPHEWIQLDNEWPKFHEMKVQRIKEKGKDLYDTKDEARAASMELLDELRNYLPARYPTLFKKTPQGIENLYNHEVFNYKTDKTLDPMYVVGHLIQDDVAILTENSQGEYIFTAGSVLLAGSWRFKDKFNTSLSSIHLVSKVPKFASNLQKSMEKFFYRLKPESPVVRYNYGFQMDGNLPWAYSTLGDEDDEEKKFRFTQEIDQIDIKDIYYRSERQSLRRLPKTGAIVFTFRAYFLPVTRVAEEPFVPRRLLNGVVNWDQESKNYKGFVKFKDILLPYLEKKAKDQEQKGYTVDKEELHYPLNSTFKQIHS